MGKYLHKEGFVREDGMVYWRYHKEKGHIWLTKEKYEMYVQTRKKYRQAGLKEYYSSREKLDPSDRSYYGKYSFAKNKYFIGLSVSGKEVWVCKERYIKHRERQNRNRYKYLCKLRAQEKTNLKVGDQHPDNKELFVCFFIGNKPYYGSKDKLQKVLERRRFSYRLRDIKYKKMRKEKLAKLQKRHHRGDINPENGTIFWEYNSCGEEKWLDSAEFNIRHAKEKQRRARSRQKAKEANKCSAISLLENT